MEASIITSIISSIFTLAGVIITVISSNNKTRNAMEVNQAVMDTRITELTREVREHNNFAKRMPVVEEQIKVINHRLEDLERSENK